MLDPGASGEDRCARAVGGVGVDHRAQTLRFRFAAGGVDLLRGHGLFASVANAGGGEQLDDVAAFLLHLADDLADFFGIAGAFVDLPQRCENARAFAFAFIDGIAQEAVDRDRRGFEWS